MALVTIPDYLLQSQDPEIFILEKLVNEQVANAGAVSSLSAKDGKSPHFQLSHTTHLSSTFDRSFYYKVFLTFHTMV